MKLDQVKEIVSNNKHGTFTQIKYITELPLKAKFKNEGYRLYKECTMVTRLGIHYGNIKEVKENGRNKDHIKDTLKYKYYWEDSKNKIVYYPDKDKYYLYTFPTKKNRHEYCKYILEHNASKEYTTLDNISDMVISSYWTKKLTSMMMLNIDNIISIGEK